MLLLFGVFLAQFSNTMGEGVHIGDSQSLWDNALISIIGSDADIEKQLHGARGDFRNQYASDQNTATQTQ